MSSDLDKIESKRIQKEISNDSESEIEISADPLNESPAEDIESVESESSLKDSAKNKKSGTKNQCVPKSNANRGSKILDPIKSEIEKFFISGKMISSQFGLEINLNFLNENDNKEMITNKPNSETFHDHFPSLRFTILNYYKTIQKSLPGGQNMVRPITFNSADGKLTAFADNGGFIRIFNNSQNKMEVVSSKSNIHGQPTSLQFSSDMSFLLVGYSFGDIRIFETKQYTQTILLTQVFEKAISTIIPIGKNEFLVADSFGNTFCFKIQRGYLMRDSVEYKRIDQLKGQTISFIEIASYIFDPITQSSLNLLLVGLKSKNQVEIFELQLNKKTIAEIINSEDSFQIHAACFNLQSYYPSSRIVFNIVTAKNLIIYELKKINVGITKDEIKFNSKKLFSLQLPDFGIKISSWLNEFTFAMFTDNCQEIFLINFSLLLNSIKQKSSQIDKDSDLAIGEGIIFDMQNEKALSKKTIGQARQIESEGSKILYQIEKDFLPETANFTITKSELADGSLIKVWEKNQNPKSLSLLDSKGIVLTISLRFWREALEVDLLENNYDGFFKNFLKVLYAKYTFFNDFIFETEQRKLIMNAYFCEKIKSMLSNKFYAISKNLVYIFDGLIEMNNYEFLLYNLKNEFNLRGESDSFDAVLESSILLNRIQRMPSNFIQEICQNFIRKQNKEIINSIILKIETFDDNFDFLANFCLSNGLYMAYIYIETLRFSDSLEETLQILISKAKHELQEERENYNQQIYNDSDVNCAKNIVIWFPFYFLKRDYFKRVYDDLEFKRFVIQIYFTYFNPSNTKTCFEISWGESLRLYGLFLKDEVFKLLQSENLISLSQWNDFINSFRDIFSTLEKSVCDFCKFYLTLRYNLTLKFLSDDPEVVAHEIIDFTKEERFIFKDFLKLVENFICDFKSQFSETFGTQFANLLATNYKLFPSNLDLLTSLLNILIELGMFDFMFLTIGNVPRQIVKTFIFEYLESKIDIPEIREKFQVEIKYFLVMNAKITFRILKKIGSKAHISEIDDALSLFPKQKLEFYKILIEEEEIWKEDKGFLEKYLELITNQVSNSGENSFEIQIATIDFLNRNSQKMSFWKIYKILYLKKLFLAIGYLFERANNLEKAFFFYFTALQNAHLLNKPDEIGLISSKLLEFMEFNSCVLLADMFIFETKDSGVQILNRFSSFLKKENTPDKEISEEFEKESRKSNGSPKIRSLKSFDSLGNLGLNKFYLNLSHELKDYEEKRIHCSAIKTDSHYHQKPPIDRVQRSNLSTTTHRKNSKTFLLLKNEGKPEIVDRESLHKTRDIPANQKNNNDLSEKLKEFSSHLKELRVTLADILFFCQKKHPNCELFKQKLVAQLFRIAGKHQLINKLQTLKLPSSKLLINSLKHHFDSQLHFSNITKIFQYQFEKEINLERLGYRFTERCSICKKNLIQAEDLESQTIIARPACFHIFHKHCYLNLFGISENDVSSSIFRICFICEKQASDLRKERVKFDEKGKIGGGSIARIINPLGYVLWNTGYGITTVLGNALALGETTDPEHQRRKRKNSDYLRKKSESIIRRQSIKRFTRNSTRFDNSKMTPVDVWISQTTHDEIRCRFLKIMDKNLFKKPYLC